MHRSTTVAITMLACVCSLAGRSPGTTLPEVYISNWIRWVAPDYEIGFCADDDSGTYIDDWQWDWPFGAHMVGDPINVYGDEDPHSIAVFSFDTAKHYYVYATAYNDFGGDDDYASVYVVEMTFDPQSGFNGYVAVNDDDDNANGIMDNCDAALGVNDDDLVRFDLGVCSQVFHWGDKVVLSVGPPEVASELLVWADPARWNVVLPYQGSYGREWPVSGGGWPSTVYLEGISPSVGLPGYDPHFGWNYYGNFFVWHDLEGWYGYDGNKWITVVHVDMDMDGVQDEGGYTCETVPGGFVPVGGLVKLTIRKVEGTTLNPSVTLAATGATSKIRVWRNQDKTGPITFGTPFATNSQLPIDLWVEGVEASTSLRDITLAMQCTLDGKTFEDEIKLTVVKVDLDISTVTDEDEEDPGAFVALNDEDDDSDGVIDYDDGYNKDGIQGNADDTNPNENDLIQITLQKVLPADLSGNVTLKANSGGTKIRIWSAPTKGGTPITLPATYATPADLPKNNLWVEGFAASGSLRDVELALEFTASGKTFDDRIKLTVLDMDVTTVWFSGTKYYAVRRDDDSMSYSGVHWRDNNGDGDTSDVGDCSYPIAYTSSSVAVDSYMKASVSISVGPSAAFSNTRIEAENDDGYNFSDTGTLNGTDLSFSSGDVQCSKKFAVETVDYYDPLILKWKISVDGGANWLDVGITDINAVYVTWRDPDPGTTLWETPLKIGCEKANGSSTDSTIISLTWSEFTDCSVCRVDGVEMKYWSPPSGVRQSIAGMLAYPSGNGSCIAWSQLLHWCMKSQGLGSVSQVWTIDPNTSVNPGADAFLVKDWNFGLHIRTGSDAVRNSPLIGDDVALTPTGINTPCILPGPNGILDSTACGNDTTQDGLYAGTSYPYGVYEDACDQTGVGGQGNPDPPGAFESHWVCKISGSIYDPSYGKDPYSTEIAHENAAIDGMVDGLRCKKNDAAQELVYLRDQSRE